MAQNNKQTDAIKAGQGPAERIATFINTYQWPILAIWFFWPNIQKNFFGPHHPTAHVNGTTVNGTTLNGTEDFQDMAPEMPEMNSWLYTLFRFVSFICMMAMFMLVSIYVQQEGMLYVPSQPYQHTHQNPPNYRTPADRGLRYEDVEITTPDGVKLRGWFILQGNNNDESRKCDTYCYFHENAGNIGLRMDYFILMNKLGYNLLIVAYRGYSESEGFPSEAGLKIDGVAIVNWLKNQGHLVDLNRCWFIGRSLGGAVGIHMLSEITDFFQGALIENTFTGISEMADKLFPFLKAIPTIKKAMLKINWNSGETIKKVKTPTLFITGTADTFVPPEMIEQLHRDFTGPYKELMIVEGGGHNDTYMRAGEAYGEQMKIFMDKCIELKGGKKPIRELPVKHYSEMEHGGQPEPENTPMHAKYE